MEVPMALAEWTVLVLLSQRPAHGFAVSQLTTPGGELGRIWRIPRPVVYRAIGRLVEAGLIEPESVEPGLGPQRTIYTVTPEGRQEAEQWLGTPVEHVRDIRSHLLVKLALLHRAGRDPAGLLTRQRAALDPIARAMQAQQGGLDASTRSCWPGAGRQRRPPSASSTRSPPEPAASPDLAGHRHRPEAGRPAERSRDRHRNEPQVADQLGHPPRGCHRYIWVSPGELSIEGCTCLSPGV
ncbi:MAG: PadR family transcriptional regulator [Solirubrobacterales bacterium]|nr:PadR family transcriptional regulator [Solirubrobacterales bacterium]